MSLCVYVCLSGIHNPSRHHSVSTRCPAAVSGAQSTGEPRAHARNMTSETLTEACPSAQATAAAAQANLLRQQEELERKAAELDRREQELHNRGATTTGDTQTHTFYTPAVK